MNEIHHALLILTDHDKKNIVLTEFVTKSQQKIFWTLSIKIWRKLLLTDVLFIYFLLQKNDPSHVFASYLAPVIIYCRGSAEDFGVITLFLGEEKGGSVVTENPKGGITENFGRIQRRDHSNLLEKYGGGGRKTWGGRSRSHQTSD